MFPHHKDSFDDEAKRREHESMLRGLRGLLECMRERGKCAVLTNDAVSARSPWLASASHARVVHR